jgi:hypothetical protein
MIRAPLVFATAKPSKNSSKEPKPTRPVHIFRKRRLEQAINQAKHICKDYEDSPECRAAWSTVEEIAATEHDLRVKDKQRKILADSDLDFWEILSEREYDL